MTCPSLRNLDKLQTDEAGWNVRGRQVCEELERLFGFEPGSQRLKLSIALLVSYYHVPGRQYLLDHGHTQEQVNAMPATQIALLCFKANLERAQDAFHKWALLPYADARVHLEQPLPEIGGPLGQIFQLSTPAIKRSLFQSAALQRSIAMLRCVEALRMHAAAHEGKLPASLAEVTQVPVPKNPVTGEPFDYALADGRAVLSAPRDREDRAQTVTAYEIKITR